RMAPQGGEAQELSQPLCGRKNLKPALETSFSGHSCRCRDRRRDHRPSERTHATSRRHGFHCVMCSPPGQGIGTAGLSQIKMASTSWKYQEYFGSRSSNSIEMPCGPRRKHILGGVRHLGELDAFLLQIGGYGIDPGDSQAEVVEALIGRRWSRIDAVAGIDLGSENHRTAKLDVDARFSKL